MSISFWITLYLNKSVRFGFRIRWLCWDEDISSEEGLLESCVMTANKKSVYLSSSLQLLNNLSKTSPEVETRRIYKKIFKRKRFSPLILFFIVCCINERDTDARAFMRWHVRTHGFNTLYEHVTNTRELTMLSCGWNQIIIRKIASGITFTSTERIISCYNGKCYKERCSDNSSLKTRQRFNIRL